MSERSPSPNLVRFLLTKWALTPTTLGDVRNQIESYSAEEWIGFDPAVIKQDLDTAITRLKVSARVRDVAKPVVLCLFDDGQQGKTTFANLLRHHGIPVFATDSFVARLREDWHGEDALRVLARQTVPLCINEFIKHVETNESLADKFIALFFDAQNGFGLKTPVSIIEGYLHNFDVAVPKVTLDKEVIKRLRKQGYRVWTTSRFREPL